jgi:hypothetical protein
MRALLLVLAVAFTLPCQAQLPTNDKSARGSFYVSVDDATTIFVNGQKIYHTGIGDHRSPETELKTGDRVLVRLHNKGGPRSFMLLFASSDGRTIVSFRNRDFKIVPDLDVTDFAPDQFQKWSKYARQERHKDRLPIKSYSDWVWGDLNHCILACIVTPQMFSQRPQ